MKSTTVTGKTANKARTVTLAERRFWLVVACAALVGLWYSIMVCIFLGWALLLTNYSSVLSPATYDFLISLSTIVGLFITSALSVPFSVIVFKRLKIQYPLVSGVAFFMALVFGFNLFGLIVGLAYYESVVIYSILAGSMIFAALLYGFALRPLKHKLSNGKFLSIAVGLAVLPVVLYLLWRLVVIKFL